MKSIVTVNSSDTKYETILGLVNLYHVEVIKSLCSRQALNDNFSIGS
jgi:hypothetical protein